MKAILSEALPAEIVGSYDAPHCTVHGNAHGDRFGPEGYALWRIVGDLPAGSELEWGTDHGDEALFVLNGVLEADSRQVETEAAVIVEAGVATRLRAVEDTRVVHVGPWSTEPPRDGILGPAQEEGHAVHVIPKEQAEKISLGEGSPKGTFFSDGTCPSCRIAFFISQFSPSDKYSAPSHFHSEDEIIHVIEGALQVGPLHVESGMSIAIPKNVRYRWQTDKPFRFLNYRPDVASYTGAPGSEPIVDTLASLRQMPDEVRKVRGRSK